jgi:hypothetical protein
MVSLGRSTPSWELKRWGRDRLFFSPAELEKYDLRGNSRYLLYRGEKESHRFTIIDNEKFEYDIILKKPPRSNKCYLFIEGWEEFDFLRQPDTFGPEILRGSYAVYKKEFTISSAKYHVGTGKICHIHRPLVWDARGREVWGDVWIDRGLMVITIPEQWLGEARYPVTVDPVVGNNSVGAYNTYPYMDPNTYERNIADGHGSILAQLAEYYGLSLDECSLFNQVSIPVAMQGNYDAYFYVNSCLFSQYYNEIPFYPFLYNGATNGKPKNPLISATSPAEGFIGTAKPKGFRKGRVTVSTKINAGTSVWFGFAGCGNIETRFDYGSSFYYAYNRYYWEDGSNSFNQNLIDTEMLNLSDSSTLDLYYTGNRDTNTYPGARVDFKISMYLQLPGEAYVRTITQGVRLNDTRVRKLGANRVITQGIKITQSINRIQTLFRKSGVTVKASMENSRRFDGKRVTQNLLGATGVTAHKGQYLRGLYARAGGLAETSHSGEYYRKQTDTACIEGVSLRHLFIFIRLITTGFVRDFIIRRFLKSNEELVIKSKVSREIEIDSKIH